MDRREFLRLAGAASLVILTPGLLRRLMAAEGGMRWDRTLVLVELQGGNDGLNTVVPYADARYYALRPKLAVEKGRVLRLSDTLGFNPVLESLMPAWNDKDLAVALGVGYAEPNRSHFRSIEIWETGSDSRETLQTGWLARALEGAAPPADLAAHGIVIGRGDEGPLAGGGLRTVIMQDPEQFFREAAKVGEVPAAEGNRALAHLATVQNGLREAARRLRERLREAPALGTEFPRSPLGSQLEGAARLLASGATVPVIKATHGGFDTHQNQRGAQDRLLRQLAEALAAFRTALQAQGLWDRVLVMTYSEFGRRAGENGSGGTDHGTAAPHLLMGGKIKGGFYGAQPSLAEKDLEDGDLRFGTDYRRLYATAVLRWWEIPGTTAETHPPLDCLG